MNTHGKFEEWAWLAPLGELSQSEYAEFLTHLDSCKECRKTYSDSAAVAEAAFVVGSSVEEDKIVEDQRYRRARQAIARRLAAVPRSCSFFPTNWKTNLAGAAVVILFFSLGTYVGGFAGRSRSVRIGATSDGRPNAIAATSAPVSLFPMTAQPTRTLQLEHELAVANKEKQALRSWLLGANHDLSVLAARVQALTEENTRQKSEKELNVAQFEEIRNNLTQAKNAIQSDQAIISELQLQAGTRETQIADLKSNLDREREMLSAGREIRDIMGARELHIIDVVDRDGKGRAKKAFGRAFYTEGKSLIFYAFDLPAANTADGKFVYAAWGSNSNNLTGKTAYSLGIFYNDDRSQHRWAMKFDDHKTLDEIDTVFITLEPANHPFTAPTGKPILEAYFGTPPNHP